MMNLRQGDCLELMKTIPDHSVDMILCDLPYGTTANKWDSVIPFDELWAAYKRIIKEHGAIVLFGSQPFTSAVVASNKKGFKHQWIWNKQRFSNPMVAHFAPLKVEEEILVFSAKGERANYYPQGLKLINKQTNQGVNVTENFGGGKRSRTYTQKYTNYPRNILSYKWDTKRVHPTQKPVDLLEYLVKTYTQPGEMVLDNCMGSGSTGVACVNTGREFIGMELDDKYFKIAQERIFDAQQQLDIA